MKRFFAVGVCLLVLSICFPVPGSFKHVADTESASIIIPKLSFRPVFEDRFIRFRHLNFIDQDNLIKLAGKLHDKCSNPPFSEKNRCLAGLDKASAPLILSTYDGSCTVTDPTLGNEPVSLSNAVRITLAEVDKCTANLIVKANANDVTHPFYVSSDFPDIEMLKIKSRVIGNQILRVLGYIRTNARLILSHLSADIVIPNNVSITYERLQEIGRLINFDKRDLRQHILRVFDYNYRIYEARDDGEKVNDLIPGIMDSLNDTFSFQQELQRLEMETLKVFACESVCTNPVENKDKWMKEAIQTLEWIDELYILDPLCPPCI